MEGISGLSRIAFGRGFTCMEYKKGNFVRHPKDEIHAQWGNGIVIEDQVDSDVKAFFENIAAVKTIRTDFVELEPVSDPGQSISFLINALYDDKMDRKPFPEVLNGFLERFEGGFNGPIYLHYERNEKLEMHMYFMANLSKERFQTALESGDLKELLADFKRSYSFKNFSLAASFELIKLHDAIKDESNHPHLAKAFYELIYGDNSVFLRVEQARKDLQRYELDKWPIITYPLFIRFPAEMMFVKPSMTQAAAQNRGFDIQYSSQVNGSTYERILNFSQDLFERLSADKREGLQPRDMIDVQGFMWCTFAGAWSDKVLNEAKTELAEEEV
jgi:hypothetical protein